MACTIDKTLDYVLFLTRHFARDDLESAILVLLLDMGFTTHSDGFNFLRQAILLRYHNSGHRFTKALYPEVGRKAIPEAGTDQVEQSIRNAITAAVGCGDEELWRCFFSDRNGNLIRPSNAEFISRIACILELWHRCCKEVAYERI